MNTRWIRHEIDKQQVKTMATQYGIAPLLATILQRRALTSGYELKYFLEDSLLSLHCPFIFSHMPQVIERIELALDEGERVLIFGDRDADGICSTVLLYEYLHERGLDVRWQVPMGDEAYGLKNTDIDMFAADDGSLIICVDCGITMVHEIAHATHCGIDIIIIDHHNIPDDLPSAFAIINQKNSADAYPYGELCAAMLVMKVIWALEFAQTTWYNERFTLLHVRALDEQQCEVSISCIENMHEQRSIHEIIDYSSTMKPLETYSFFQYLKNTHIVIYHLAEQQALLYALFGAYPELDIQDMAPMIWRSFPSVKQCSLEQLLSDVRMVRYYNGQPSAIGLFRQLFLGVIQQRLSFQNQFYAKCTEMSAIATIADMMQLKNENRVVVKQGLRFLSKSLRPGMQQLLAKLNLYKKSIAPAEVAWVLGPIINASGRMGEPDKAIRLFLSQDNAEIIQLTDELIAMNALRRSLTNQAWKRAQTIMQSGTGLIDNRLCVVYDEKLIRGLTGLVAGKISREYMLPAIVLAPVSDYLYGSMRSVAGFLVTRFLSYFDDILQDWGGHDEAGGFHLDKRYFDEFMGRLSSALQHMSAVSIQEEVIEIDAEIPHKYMTMDLCELVEHLSPYGQGFKPIQFLYRGACIEDITFIGKQQTHARMQLRMGVLLWIAIYWNSAEYPVVHGLKKNDCIDIVFQINKNLWRGHESWQLCIIDCVLCSMNKIVSIA